jgi:hypothetical protein
MPSPAPSNSLATAEARARALLAQEKWRQARDELKALVKTDRARFLPLLVQANLGLARKMLASGQASEARQVLAYLATIAPPAELRAFELELAAKSAAPQQGLPQFAAALAEPVAPLAEAERIQLADLVVLSFAPVPEGTPAQARLAAEVRAIHEALQALAQQQWPELSAALRPVPHRSALSHWAVFIKGVAAFYADETDRAVKLLRSLPPGSVPARAAAAYLVLIGDAAPATAAGGAPPLTEALAGQIGRLTGAAGLAGVLWRADSLWREGRPAESYRVVRNAVAAFPSQEPDRVGALTTFYFHAPHGLTGKTHAEFMDMFDGLLAGNRCKSPVETMLANRMFALVNASVATPEGLRSDWECFLGARRTLRGPNARFDSLAYGWLGGQLARTYRAPGFFRGPPRLRDPAGAVEVLQRSIALDPANLGAHLQLCTVHTALKQTGELNRLLDAMTARFPDDKQVLLRAAEGCLARKAFGKGLGYLARARQLDQLDPRIPELTVAANLQLARQHFQQKRAEKARQAFAVAEGWLTDRAEDLQRGRWTVRVRQAVMERLWGEAALADAAEAQARAAAPSRAAQWLFAHFAHRVCAKGAWCESPFLAEFKQALREGRSVGEIGRLLRIVRHWAAEAEELHAGDEYQLLAGALGAAIERPFTRAEVLAVIAGGDAHAALIRPIERLVKKTLKADPLDPAFRLWLFAHQDRMTAPSLADRPALQSILDEAIRRHDEGTMREVRQMIGDLDLPPPPDPFDPTYGGPDADELADPGDEDDFEPGGGLPPDLPPELREQMFDLMDKLNGAPDSVVRELRRQMVPPVPPELFDALVVVARQGPGALPPLPPWLPAPKPGRPAPPSNQLDLF